MAHKVSEIKRPIKVDRIEDTPYYNLICEDLETKLNQIVKV